MKDKLIKNFKKYIEALDRIDSGKISIDIPLKKKEKSKAEILFTAKAFAKIRLLVETAMTEIAWHGTVERLGKQSFLITDIFVYPQEITSATVNMDTAAYGEWLAKLPDNIFDNLRFQGHSHVNMGVYPSAVDKNSYNEILNLLKDDDFYIFAIFNKQKEVFIELYDLKTNALYEKEDIVISIVDNEGNNLSQWANKQIKEKLQKPKPLYNWRDYEQKQKELNRIYAETYDFENPRFY